MLTKTSEIVLSFQYITKKNTFEIGQAVEQLSDLRFIVFGRKKKKNK